MIDHSQCDHPRTKAGRASCRRKGEQSADYAQSPHYDLLTWAEHLALDLMSKHGLFDHGWQFQWDRAVRRFGRTRSTIWNGKFHGFISLSRPLTPLCTPEEIRNTILHEIAHALTGCGEGHSAEWKRTAVRIGAKPERCMEVADKELPARYILRCNNCGHESRRYKKSKHLGKSACRLCCGKYNGGKFTTLYLLEVIEL